MAATSPPASVLHAAAPLRRGDGGTKFLARPKLRLATTPPTGSRLVRGGAGIKTVAAFVGLCAIWGSTWLAIKVGLRDLPPISFAGIRFAFAALILYAIVGARGLRLPWAARDWRLLLWTGLLSITVNYALVFWAELHISSGLAAVLNATIPLFGLPLAHRMLAAEPMTSQKVGGVVLGVLGMAIVFGAELGGNTPMAAWASAGVLVASLAGAQAGVLVKARGTHLDPAVLAGVQMAFGSLPLLVIGAAVEGSPFRLAWTPVALASLAYLTVVGSVVAFLAYYWLIRHIEVTRVLLIPLITPLVAVGLGYAFLGERVTWGTAVGGTAILGGVGLALWNGGRRS
ncbi:MAG TPA: EamA family transporter [Gemmatimonadales bacterium]|nr:EamA family transporter [Gemmatimonadales bacterium]